MKNFVKQGDTLTVKAPAGGVVSGAALLIGAGIFGVAITDAAEADDVEIKRSGVFEDMPKATGAAWAQGDVLYWDATNKVFTKTATSNTRVGTAAEVAASGDAVGVVSLGYPVG